MSLTREEENFVKLSKIILDIVANHIRRFFKEKWDLKYPHKIWDDTTSVSGQFLLTQIRKSPPNAAVKGHLQVGDTRYWDPTALFFVLLQSGLSIIDPCRPYAKRTIPLRDSEELDKLREIRNEYFAHASSMSVSQGDYQKVIAVIELVCKALNWHWASNEITAVDHSPIKTQLSDNLRKELAAQKEQSDEYNEYLIQLEERIERTEKNVAGLDSRVIMVEGEMREVKQQVEYLGNHPETTKEIDSRHSDFVTAIKSIYKTSLEKWQRNYFQVQGDTLTAEFPKQQRCDEWVAVSLTEVKQINAGFKEERKEQSVDIPIDLTKIINKDRKSKLNFLSGPPGIGKSSLLDYAVLSWAEDKFFNGENGCMFELILRFKCCDLVRYSGKKITKEELFEKNFGRRAYASLLENVDPNDVLIILDGIDEFYAVDRLFTCKADDEMSYLIEDLIKPDSSLSPGHYVLVSGRPYAIQMLDQKAGKIGKGRFVKIQGFTSDGIETFTRKFTRVDLDLNNYITNRIKESLALRMCSKIPLFLHNICYILKAEKEQCKTFQLETVTDIYTISLCLVIKFHCKIGSQDLSDMGMHLLLKDENIKTFLERITAIAWSLLKEKRVFLNDKEIKEIREGDPKIQCLIEGFFWKISNELEESFQFVHLNMQEYLAAIHCVKSNVDPKDLLDGMHVEVLKFMAGFLGVAVKSNVNPQGLLDWLYYEVLQFVAALVGVEARPKDDKRENRKKVHPKEKLKSLLLSERSVDESRIERHAKLIFQEYKRNKWRYPCPAPLLDLFFSTMFEMFDQSAALPSFIDFSDEIFRIWITSELHLRMFIHFCQRVSNANRQYLLRGLDVTIKRLEIKDADVLEGLLDSILACNTITFRRCIINATFDRKLNEKVQSRIPGENFYLKQMKIIDCEISSEFRRLAATLTPSVLAVYFSLQRTDFNVLMREIKEEIEISTNDPKRPFSLKYVHLKSHCLHSGHEGFEVLFCDICMQAKIEEVAKVIPLIEYFRITTLYLSAAEVELISASIVERAIAEQLLLKSFSLLRCRLRPEEDITKLAPAIPYIENVDLRGYWLEFQHYAMMFRDITKQSKTISVIGDIDIRGKIKNVKSLFRSKGITHEVASINVVRDHEMDEMPFYPTIIGKASIFQFSKDD